MPERILLTTDIFKQAQKMIYSYLNETIGKKVLKSILLVSMKW